jgi:cytochrome P450
MTTITAPLNIRPVSSAPLAPGSLPYLGHALKLNIDPLSYFLGLYRQYGPVFRLRLLGREYVVLAGIEANRWMATADGDGTLGSGELFGSFAQELGSDAMLVALDGVPHRHQRKFQQRAYSKGTFMNHLSDVIAITRQAAQSWPAGHEIALFPTLQRIVTDHLGMLVGGRPCGPYFDDMWTLLNMSLKVHVLKSHPRLYLRHPRYQRAKQRVIGFAREVLDWHRANPPAQTGREPRLADDLLAALDENGQPYSEGMMVASLGGAYFAGMDTVASSMSFMLYAIVTTPGLQERLRAEVDAAFAEHGDALTPSALRGMSLLHDTAIEALRRYPVAPFTPRTVMQPFGFGGYHFPVGTGVYIANALPHLMEEFYPNPLAFDPDRYGRADYVKTPQAFAPFTLGAHTCLGAGMAEAQLMATVATILHSVELELAVPHEPLVIYANPLPNPGRKLALRVQPRR